MADDQVRQVQDALRKRHLFYGNANGEMSPALSAAIARYQEKKGFPRTGSLDVETCASLGIVRPVAHSAQTPFVVENNGTVRGANGETLPDALPWPADKYPVRVSLTHIDQDDLGPSPLAPETEPKRVAVSHPKSAPGRPRARVRPQKETNPLVLAFRSVKSLFTDKGQKRKRTTTKRF